MLKLVHGAFAAAGANQVRPEYIPSLPRAGLP